MVEKKVIVLFVVIAALIVVVRVKVLFVLNATFVSTTIALVTSSCLSVLFRGMIKMRFDDRSSSVPDLVAILKESEGIGFTTKYQRHCIAVAWRKGAAEYLRIESRPTYDGLLAHAGEKARAYVIRHTRLFE